MDITNKKLAAQCLIEAAELLDESAGYNGIVPRLAKQRADKAKSDYEKEKAKNDEIDKINKSKIEIYKRAGYADKAPGAIARIKENELKNYKGEEEKRLKRAIDEHEALKMFKNDKNWRIKSKMAYMNNALGNKLYDKLEKAKDGTGSPLHKRINDRAKAKNESISLLLDEAIELLERED